MDVERAETEAAGTMEISDGELLARYRGGEVSALEELVEKYRRPLFAFILNMTEGRGDADEIFQEVWFRAIRNLKRYKQKNFLGWLMRIAHNLVIDRARRKKPDVSLDQAPRGGDEDMALINRVPSRETGPDGLAEAGDLGQVIAAAVATLPLEQREVFLMRTEMELPFKEIAGIQDVSINTALARMQYALGKLRPMLREHYRALGKC